MGGGCWTWTASGWTSGSDGRSPPGVTLRVQPVPGRTDEHAAYLDLGEEVLDDTSGTVVLPDAFGGEVARFEYRHPGGS